MRIFHMIMRDVVGSCIYISLVYMFLLYLSSIANAVYTNIVSIFTFTLLFFPLCTHPHLPAETYTKQSFLEVLGEQWCGGLADYFIVTKTSGLGRQSAFRSKRLKNRVVVLEAEKAAACKVVDLMAFGAQNSKI